MESLFTYSLMGLFIFIFGAIILIDCRYDGEKNSLFDLYDTNILRGLWCIVIILVHIPELYKNKISELVGSFAYIGVTYFFMTSAYGLKYGVLHKKNYLKGFWSKRLPNILIPMLITNLISVGIEWKEENNLLLELIYINSWIKLILLFYMIFWLVYYILGMFYGGGTG